LLAAENVSKVVSMLRDELRVLGAITARGLALYTVGGKQIYSDLDPPVEERLKVFVSSFPGLSIGSHITVTIGERTLIIMRLSERSVLAVFTHQRVGIVLVKMSALIKSYGTTLDKLLEGVEEEQVPSIQLPEVSEVKTEEVPVEEQPSELVEAPVEGKAEVEEAKAEEVEAERRTRIVTVQVPVIMDESILKKCSDRERKILEMCDGERSIDEIAKETGIPFFEILQLCTKYSVKKKIKIIDRPRIITE